MCRLISIAVTTLLALSLTPAYAEDYYISHGEKTLFVWLLFFLLGLPLLRFLQLLLKDPRTALNKLKNDVVEIAKVPSYLSKSYKDSHRLVGNQCPDMTFQTFSGSSLLLTSFRHKIVVVRWWNDQNDKIFKKHQYIYPDDQRVLYLFAYIGSSPETVRTMTPPIMSQSETLIVVDTEMYLTSVFKQTVVNDSISALVLDFQGVLRTPPHPDSSAWEKPYGLLYSNELKDKYLIEKLCRLAKKALS